MTIQLPDYLVSSVEAAVQSGRFPSVDDAMEEAVRLLLRELELGQQQTKPPANASNPDPVLGCMRDDADLMDEIVADAYRHRREETWREFE